MTSHYEILYLPFLNFTLMNSGVNRLCSTKEIKQAYRRIALTSHPDKVSLEQREEATKKFQDIQVAYHTLQDAKRRREYDREIFDEERAVYTPPGSFYEGDGRRGSWFGSGDLPPTPESPGQGRDGGFWSGNRASPPSESSFDSRREFQEYERRPKLMTFLEATLLFHPEDRRHLWLCSEEDDPASGGGNHITKSLHVSLQEYSFTPSI
jgi:curved DNA-binding protein CbpA